MQYISHKLLRSCLYFAVSLFLSATHASTEKKYFTIGVEQQLYYPHYHYENGEFSGYARELLDTYAQHKGYIFRYIALPVNDLFKALVAREIDFKYPDNPYWQHVVKEGVRIAYSNPVTPYIDGVTVTPSNTNKGLKSLQRLGTLEGFTPLNYEYYIKSGRIKLIEMRSTTELIKAALIGDIDGVYANVDVISHQASKKFPDSEGLVFDRSLPYTAQSYMLSTAKNPQLLKEFNHFLLLKARLIKDLKQKYKINDIMLD